MVGLLKKVLGGGKSDFFLELDESQQSETEAKQPESKPVEPPAAEKPAAEAQSSQAQPPSQSKTSNNKPAQKPAPASTQAKASEPQSAAEIIAAAVNGSKATSSEAVEDKTFAPNYLMPVSTQSRRRPGPSLKMFQDMARQVNGSKG